MRLCVFGKVRCNEEPGGVLRGGFGVDSSMDMKRMRRSPHAADPESDGALRPAAIVAATEKKPRGIAYLRPGTFLLLLLLLCLFLLFAVFSGGQRSLLLDRSLASRYEALEETAQGTARIALSSFSGMLDRVEYYDVSDLSAFRLSTFGANIFLKRKVRCVRDCDDLHLDQIRIFFS